MIPYPHIRPQVVKRYKLLYRGRQVVGYENKSWKDCNAHRWHLFRSGGHVFKEFEIKNLNR